MVEINPHDLLKIDSISALSDELPSWADSIFPNSLTVVVRRSPLKAGLIPVGVRGIKREHRFATYVDLKDVLEVTTPYELVEKKVWERIIPERQILPAIKALPKVDKVLHDYHWGISGSVGFELATGTRAAKMTSDLDLVWLPEQEISKCAAGELLKELNQFGVHADLQVIQANNGFSLEEYANSTSTIMMKTLEDPILVKDPWLK
ncbi:malonate decarboxylase holo-ACP synthase [Companilactobacillus kimchii]|uniref:Phosphoribosyl-dephospho-CoA transferase n=2 Tax=Companilactobacillus kimchii TaxID=2801452 RepID=A0ABR5NUZ1_9LACO|nr:malonate decarboxylase holo-ACP synthase [Companilactobacillus kimchii]KAE9563124.1 phosphoribosyl-dephospho-CoA transferase [Companilactobacillus kimchii]KRK52641.1 phosphoribosyl-dephospho-CoA transferase [Companilactobacillus kimchii DSM 13961 = JCM 10707]OWF32292.1 Malonate decarboxylase holo-[acyl-carrier protein] synthase [Companilactobacillus kimchii]GEO47318.1 malonate decarboxylase holo-ACP synthase [Companilactobacillus paralimentarius]